MMIRLLVSFFHLLVASIDIVLFSPLKTGHCYKVRFDLDCYELGLYLWKQDEAEH